MKYATLGDIAAEIHRMKSDGMTRSAVEYVLDQVYYELEEEEARK